METNYKFLVFDHHPWRKSPYIRSRNASVDMLIPQYMAGLEAGVYSSPEDFARDRDLPLEAVVEMIEWYEKNKSVVDEDCRKGRELLGVKD